MDQLPGYLRLNPGPRPAVLPLAAGGSAAAPGAPIATRRATSCARPGESRPLRRGLAEGRGGGTPVYPGNMESLLTTEMVVTHCTAAGAGLRRPPPPPPPHTHTTPPLLQPHQLDFKRRQQHHRCLFVHQVVSSTAAAAAAATAAGHEGGGGAVPRPSARVPGGGRAAAAAPAAGPARQRSLTALAGCTQRSTQPSACPPSVCPPPPGPCRSEPGTSTRGLMGQSICQVIRPQVRRLLATGGM